MRPAPPIANGTLGMILFAVAEAMLFAGLISAHTIAESNAIAGWPPIGQPRLPVASTAFNTAMLLASGAALLAAHRSRAASPTKGLRLLGLAIALGLFFVVFQGAEWVALLHEGLTLTSSNHGAFFYLIVGFHGAHAVGALALLVHAALRWRQDRLTDGLFGAAQVLWYFVVAVWPFLYIQVYL